MKLARHYIDGEWRGGDAALRDSFNPADGSVLGQFHPGSKALADEAAQVARRAFSETGWTGSPRHRAQALCEFAERMEAAKEEITDLIVAENGKLRAEAAGEMAGSISAVRYYAGLARAIQGRMQETMPGNFSLLHREPAGVAAIIVPWNAPVSLMVRSLAPALAAGCTCLIKPADQTPLIHARVMECLADCPSLPAGVVNSVNENGTEVGQALVASPEVDVVSFTGSSHTGKLIMAAAAPTLKRVNLELGGKAPAVIFPDADLDLTVRELTHGSLVLAGQICAAASRFIVHASIREAFEQRMVAAYKSVRTGPGAHPESQMGSLIDVESQRRLMRVIAQASDEGEMLLQGEPLGQGAFLTPSLFRIGNLESDLVQDEMLGPISSVETFEDEAQAVLMANATVYGLAASVFTRDLNRAMRVSRAIRSGTVWLNSHLRLLAEAETGGYGHSGLGRLNGVEGLNDFLETKHVYLEAGAVPGA